jgi:tetratricopeptide (TPR) repeat protein
MAKLNIILALLILALTQYIHAQIADNYLLLAKTYNQMHQPTRAIELIESLDQEKLNSALLIEKANGYYQLQDFRSAIQVGRNISQTKHHEVNYLMARCYAKLNQADSAMLYLLLYLDQPDKLSRVEIYKDKAFENLQKSKPWFDLWQNGWYSNMEEQLEAAKILMASEKYTEALFQLDDICTHYKSNHEAYALKASIYLKNNNYKDALTSINNAIAQNKRNAGYYSLQAKIFEAKAQYKKALESINKALEIDNSELHFYLKLAELEHKNGNDTTAFEMIEEMLGFFTDNSQLLETAIKIYSGSGAYLPALKMLNKIMKDQPNPQLYKFRADTYFKAKSWSLALTDYSMWLDFYPEDGSAYYQMGWCYFYQQQYTDACQFWSKARRFGYLEADKPLKEQCR